MRIVIIGAGAMGSLFGAMLQPVADVCLINRSSPHVLAVQDSGLTIEDINGDIRTCDIAATVEPEKLAKDADAAIIFTKSYDTEAAAHTASKLLKDDGFAITLQNGVGNAEVIEAILGRERTAAGVSSHGATLLAPGRVRHAGQGPTVIGTNSPEIDLKPLAKIFEQAGIDTEISENPLSVIWGKLIINVGINALTAILRVHNGVLAETPECERIMAEAVSEAVSIAHALNIQLPYEEPLERVKAVCQMTANNKASMLQDVINKRPTEIGVINGAIVKKGKEAGISTPCNHFITEIIQAVEAVAEKRIEF